MTPRSFTRRVWFLAFLLLALSTGCSNNARSRTRENAPTPTPSESLSPIALSSIVSIEMGYPCGVEVSSRSAWVLSCEGTLYRISKATGDVTEHRRRILGALDPMVGAGESLWLLLARRSGKDWVASIEEIAADSGKTRRVYQVGNAVPSDAKVFGDVVWVAMLDGRILAIESGTVREVTPRGGEPISRVAVDENWIWTINENADVVQRVLRDGRILRKVRNAAPSVLSAEAVAGSLWAALGDGGVVAIDGETGVVTRLDVQGSANHIEACGEFIWLSQQILGEGPLLTKTGLRALDLNGRVIKTMELRAGPAHLACDGSRLWIVSDDSSLGSINV